MSTMSFSEISQKPYLSVNEFAFLMSYHRKTVERQIKKGMIPIISIGTSSIRIDMEAFKRQGQK